MNSISGVGDNREDCTQKYLGSFLAYEHEHKAVIRCTDKCQVDVHLCAFAEGTGVETLWPI